MKIFKENWLKISIGGILALLPVIFHLCAWDFITEKSISHPGETAKALTGLIIVSAVLFVLFIALIALCGAVDKRFAEQDKKMITLVFLTIPVVSIYANAVTVACLLGLKFSVLIFAQILFGVLFVIIGNYMPKCKQSFTLGVRIRWTLANKANWAATHRFTGHVWVGCGVTALVSIFLPETLAIIISCAVLLCAIVAPFTYSYLYYKKQLANGEWSDDAAVAKIPKSQKIISAIVVPLILAICAVLMLTGNIKAECSDTAITVSATYSSSITVSYSDIESVEYRESLSAGARVMGFASSRILAGMFQNDEFSTYTRYTYTGDKSCIVIKHSGGVLVYGAESNDKTQEIYNTLLEKAGK